MDPVTFEVRFHSDPTFEDLTSTGASAANAALVGPAGFGVVGAEETDSSVRGRRDDDTRAFVLTNPSELDVFVGWDDTRLRAVRRPGGGTVDDEGDQDLSADVSVQGSIVNEPPHADAGDDQRSSARRRRASAVLLDGRASGDPEDNAILFSWFRDSRVGEPSAIRPDRRAPAGARRRRRATCCG